MVYTINGKGLRDREYSYQKPTGVRRVLVFGDSFTFGSGVTQDQCFTEIAETALNGVEILNMGVPGYGLDQILLSFIAQGELYQPDMVVVFLNSHVTGRNRTGIVEGNMVRVPDALEAVEFAGESGGTAYLRPDDPLVTSGRSWLVRHSHALSFLTYRLQVRRLQKQLEAEDERFWRKSIRFNQWAPLHEDILPERRQRTIVLLRELMRRVASVGARLLVVNIDRNVAVSFLRSQPGLDLVDLSRELTARAKTAPLTFTYDQHYNAETHRFLGERLAEELRRRLEKR